jgi:glycosyltransferase involved in cell wall biosynthesis
MTSIDEKKEKLKRDMKLAKFMVYVIAKYDIIHFHSRPTFLYVDQILSTYNDTKWLKRLGKKIFISFWGCDVRDCEIDSKYSWSPCRTCTTNPYCKQRAEKVITASKKYCSKMFSSGDLCVEYPELQWVNLAVDTSTLNPSQIPPIPDKYKIDKQEDEIVIYHSFGNSKERSDVKGIKYIDRAIKNINRDGHRIKYIFIDSVPTTDMKYIQLQADIVIDQLCAGWYGTTAVECMSLEKPVIAYMRKDILDICPNKNIPVINASPNTIEAKIRELISLKDDLKEIGESGRKYVEKYHDRQVVAKELLKYYREG